MDGSERRLADFEAVRTAIEALSFWFANMICSIRIV